MDHDTGEDPAFVQRGGASHTFAKSGKLKIGWLSVPIFAVLMAFGALKAAGVDDAGVKAGQQQFESTVAPFLKSNCISCHGAKRQKGNITFATLGSDPMDPQSVALWQRILEQVEIEAMPPEDSDQPSAIERSHVIQWIYGYLIRSGRAFEVKSKLLLPEFGNRVSHELLFNGTIKAMPSSPSRLWRISPYVYDGKRFQPGQEVRNEPLAFSTKSEGIRDYASQEVLGESEFSMLMMAFDDALSKQMHNPSTAFPSFKPIVEAKGPPPPAALERVIREEYLRAVGRQIGDEDLARYLAFMKRGIEQAGNESGLKIGVMAIYLSPQALYRLEIGMGPADEFGRRMLSPQELGYALSYALTDSPPSTNTAIRDALAAQRLSTRADVERVVRQVLSAGAFARLNGQTVQGYAYLARVQRFFEEFFDYPKSAGVFKDGKHGMFGPRVVPATAQQHIAVIVNADSHVFEELLTSRRFNHDQEENLAQLKTSYESRLKTLPDGKEGDAAREYEAQIREARKKPTETARTGILTDQAWLIAYSKCTENDPVRRGKWIRERLLAGNVPDLPIGVAAKIPDDPDRTLRDRFTVVQDAACWKCHKSMNPLGMAFEGFNDLGKPRTGLYLDVQKKEFLEKIDQTEAENLLKQGQIKILPVDASGELTGTGDSALDGPVKDAADLVNRLAKSSRVRQSIIRHAFRYWMGRNETLSDSRTLIAADQAYVSSGGKFSEVIVSLLTSDSFLYRK